MTTSLFEMKETGRVQEIRHALVRVAGLPTCLYGQYCHFESGVYGMVMSYNERDVFVLVLGDISRIQIGEQVSAKMEPIRIGVGENLIGRGVNSLGQVSDGGPMIDYSDYNPIFRSGPQVMERTPITEQLHTGTKIVDTIIPIGRGQRELILGDRKTGKTSFATDAILNQKGKDVICIYCLVGKMESFYHKVTELFRKTGASDYTIVLSETAASSAGQQYLAPYAAAAIGEYFMARGKHVLTVFDDLTKHAWIYRQIMLLIGRTPGREAYPGDMFYVHAQLMERAGKLRRELGGGSMTFFPICETQQGNVTGHIPSSLISMTDGQIYFNASIFNEGFRPAIDIGLSVSRIGNKVQPPALKEVSRAMRFEYTQHAELLKLTRFRAAQSEELLQRLRRGKVLRALLTQKKNAPVTLEEEILFFFAMHTGLLEKMTPEKLEIFCEKVHPYFRLKKAKFLSDLSGEAPFSSEMRKEAEKAIREFILKENLLSKD